MLSVLARLEQRQAHSDKFAQGFRAQRQAWVEPPTLFRCFVEDERKVGRKVRSSDGKACFIVEERAKHGRPAVRARSALGRTSACDDSTHIAGGSSSYENARGEETSELDATQIG